MYQHRQFMNPASTNVAWQTVFVSLLIVDSSIAIFMAFFTSAAALYTLPDMPPKNIFSHFMAVQGHNVYGFLEAILTLYNNLTASHPPVKGHSRHLQEVQIF